MSVTSNITFPELLLVYCITKSNTEVAIGNTRAEPLYYSHRVRTVREHYDGSIVSSIVSYNRYSRRVLCRSQAPVIHPETYGLRPE